MGCGKSKHADVASGNTALKRKTSTIQSNRKTKIKTDIIKSKIDNDMIIFGVVEKESEIVEEAGGYNIKDKVENEHAQEEKVFEKSNENGGVMEKKEEIIPEGTFEKSIDEIEDSLIKENEVILNNVIIEVNESAAKEKNAMLERFEGVKDHSLKESGKKEDVDVAEERGIPEESVVMVEKLEGEKEESLEENNEGVNAAFEEKDIVEEKKTESEDFKCGKGDFLEENPQEAIDNDAEVKKPENEQGEESVEVNVNKDMEPLTSKCGYNVVKSKTT